MASASLVTLAAALAVRDAIAHVSPLSLDVKWPNDLMYRGRKVSGILAEAQTTAGRLDIFLGIGINLKPDPELPPEVARLATSISEAGGGEPGMESLLAALVDALEPRLREVDENPAQILGDWRARLSTLGQDVTVQLFEGSVRGRAIDVGAGGELVLALPGGGTRLISAGDVVVAPPPGRCQWDPERRLTLVWTAATLDSDEAVILLEPCPYPCAFAWAVAAWAQFPLNNLLGSSHHTPRRHCLAAFLCPGPVSGGVRG